MKDVIDKRIIRGLQSDIKPPKKIKVKVGGQQDTAHIATQANKDLVCKMYSAGITRERIANHLEISVMTLIKYYKNCLDIYFDNRKANLCEDLYNDALNGCKKSREFWLTHLGGLYAAKAPVEITDKAQSFLEIFMEKHELKKEEADNG